jgi:hypothetical protein
MILYKTQRARWIGGLIIILIIYTVFYIYFVENDVLWIPRKIRHVIKFLCTVAVYFVGTYHLGKLNDKWMSHLWHFIHISLLTIITSVGLFDWIFGMVSEPIKDMTWTMQEFLISPVLYVGMGILNNRLNASADASLKRDTK